MLIWQQKRDEEAHQQQIRWDDEHRQEMRELIRMMASRSDTPRLATSDSEAASHQAQPKVVQFRNYKYGEDIVTYLTTFESHYRGYNISENEWMLKLRPLLPEELLDTVYSMRAEEQTMYEDKLYDHFRVNKVALVDRAFGAVRRKGERWRTFGSRLHQLFMRYVEGCTTIDEAMELVTMAHTLRQMPPAIAARVREQEPETLDDATKWADATWCSKGWDYNSVPNKDTKKPFISERLYKPPPSGHKPRSSEEPDGSKEMQETP